jgi:hypothetical protein
MRAATGTSSSRSAGSASPNYVPSRQRYDSEGNFELFTAGKEGDPPGWYKVVVSAFANKPEEGRVAPRLLLDDKYYDEGKTDLCIEVVASPSPGAYDLKVSKRATPRR